MAAIEHETDAAPTPLDIPLRGERTYLHSTTLIDKLLALTGAEGRVRLELRQMLTSPLEMSRAAADAAKASGVFSYDDRAGQRQAVYILQNAALAPSGRVACNEKAVIASGEVTADRAEAQIGNPGTFIETVVGLMKALVQARVGAGRKPIFSRIDVRRVPAEGRVRVKLASAVGTRLFVAELSLLGDGQPDEVLGQLVFITV